MRVSPIAAVAFSLIVSTAGPLRAAPATDEQAQAIKTALQRYVGTGGAGGSTVTVTPKQESYDVDLDMKQVLSGLEQFGVAVDPWTFHFNLMPQGGTLWKVTSSGPNLFGGHYGTHTAHVAINGSMIDGVFDSAIPTFVTATAAADSISTGIADGKNGTQTRETVKAKQTLSTTPAGDGAVDLRDDQTSESFSQDMTMDQTARPGAPPAHIGVKGSAVVDSTKLDGLRVRALADLWAFLVAHPSADAMKADQAALRTHLLALLPVFDHGKQSTAFDAVDVDSPVGPFAARAFSALLDINGLVRDGSIASTIKFDGLTIPQGLTPPWADGLIPVKVDLTETFAGFHLDAAAKAAIDDYDLSAPQPYTPEQKQKLRALLGPLDQMVLTIAPSRIVTRLLDLKIEGRARFEQPLPDFDVKINLTGLDKAILDMQAKGGDDPHVASAMAVVALVKGYGKAEPDGSLSWNVVRDDTGSVLVNGVILPIGKGR